MYNLFCICASRVSRKGRGVFPCLVAILLFASCQSYKKVPYLQDAKVVEQTTQQENLYDAKIMPKDLLTIVVSCTSPELAVPFNLTVATQNNVAITSTTSQPILQQYLVDNDGKINFPVLGELRVGGLTKKEAEQLIVEKLKPYIKETPIVTVRMVNYKISVLGEVARPGTFTISNEKVNLLEALAMAGDMTVWDASYLFPVRHFTEMMQNMLYGSGGFTQLWPSAMFLCIFPLLAFSLLPHLKRAIESHKYENIK